MRTSGSAAGGQVPLALASFTIAMNVARHLVIQAAGIIADTTNPRTVKRAMSRSFN